MDELLSEPSKCNVTLLWYITRKVSAPGRETERIIHGCLDMWDSSLCGQLPCCALLCDIKLNTRREISDLKAAMYYFVYYMNTLLTRKSWLNSRLRKNHSCRRNRLSDVSVADWQYQAHMKNYCNQSFSSWIHSDVQRNTVQDKQQVPYQAFNFYLMMRFLNDWPSWSIPVMSERFSHVEINYVIAILLLRLVIGLRDLCQFFSQWELRS